MSEGRNAIKEKLMEEWERERDGEGVMGVF